MKEAKKLLDLTLDSLKANLEFLDKEYRHVNLDAVIGTRIVDGKKMYIYDKAVFSLRGIL